MSTPRCIAKNIFTQVAPLAEDAGVCASTPQGKALLLEQIDLAARAVVKRIDTEGMIWDFPVPVYQGCFALPIDCESDRNIFVNGNRAIQRDQWYEGKLAWGRNGQGIDCRTQCIDQGQFAIPLPLPKRHSMRIAVIAQENGDEGKEVQIEVINQYGNRVKETLILAGAGDFVRTSSMAYDVTLFEKEETVGNVQLQVYYDNGARFQIGHSPVFATYPPKCRQGYFRRKKLPQMQWGCNMVTIKGKLKLYPINNENDILPFEDVLAWRFALAAIDAQTRGEMDDYNTNLAMALNELSRSMQDSDPAGNVAQAKFSSGFGSNPSWAGGRGRCWA